MIQPQASGRGRHLGPGVRRIGHRRASLTGLSLDHMSLKSYGAMGQAGRSGPLPRNIQRHMRLASSGGDSLESALESAGCLSNMRVANADRDGLRASHADCALHRHTACRWIVPMFRAPYWPAWRSTHCRWGLAFIVRSGAQARRHEAARRLSLLIKAKLRGGRPAHFGLRAPFRSAAMRLDMLHNDRLRDAAAAALARNSCFPSFPRGPILRALVPVREPIA